MTQSISPTADQGQLAVTYRDAGHKVGVCERTIWNLVKNRELKAIRIGRSVRIPIAELERFIADQTKQG